MVPAVQYNKHKFLKSLWGVCHNSIAWLQLSLFFGDLVKLIKFSLFTFETNTAHKPSDNMSLANNSSVGGFGDGGNIKVVDPGNFLFIFFSTLFHFSSCRKGSGRQTVLLRKFLPGPMCAFPLVFCCARNRK